MLSLYIHTPFCDHKCDYCSFHVIPTNKVDDEHGLIQQYVASLQKDILEWWALVGKEEIKTIYFWWGTPTKLWVNNLCDIIDLLAEQFDLENIGELTIECNPEPEEVIYDLVKTLSKKYKKFPRIRLSVGIQTFDTDILKDSKRQYTFNQVVLFLRTLQKLKKHNISYNLDFIAFGKRRSLRNGDAVLRRPAQIDFLEGLIHSHMADSFSVYTLELFPGSKWYADRVQHTDKIKDWHGLKQYGTDDEVYDEFVFLKELLLQSKYRRYELSNFSLTGKSSIHNRAYWEMESYLGLWSGASWFINSSHQKYDAIVEKLTWDTKTETQTYGIRRSNTEIIKHYLIWERVNQKKTLLLSEKDYQIEAFFLWLRTDRWVRITQEVEAILVANYIAVVEQLVDQWFLREEPWKQQKLQLTDQWMDVYNEIVTNLLEDI